jgi:DNA polymerase-1
MINPDTETGAYHVRTDSGGDGRLASNDPNLQNIPIRTAEGRRIRESFVAPPGSTIVSADYSQVELRIMAHISQDASLLKAFASAEDIHRATAGEIFGMAPAEVGGEQRRYAKVINFGLIYGMSAFGLARPARHRAHRGAAVHGALLRPLSGGEALHGRHARAGARARLRGNGVRTPAMAA